MGFYNVTNVRRITAADQNIYIKGSKHPDRVMDEHDLVYILEGTWEIYQNDKAYILFPDDVIILHANQHHYGLKPCEPNTRTMYIHVNNDQSDIFEAADSEYKPENSVKLDTVIHCHSNEKVKRFFKEIIFTHWSNSQTKEFKTSLLFQLLLCELAECKDTSSNNSLVEKAIHIMKRNPNKILKVEELAAQLFVSGKTLRNKFNTVFQKTPTKFQMEMKLEKACMLLREYPEMPLSEIAGNLGFYDEFHFSKTFKKMYGMAPGSFRKSLNG